VPLARALSGRRDHHIRGEHPTSGSGNGTHLLGRQNERRDRTGIRLALELDPAVTELLLGPPGTRVAAFRSSPAPPGCLATSRAGSMTPPPGPGRRAQDQHAHPFFEIHDRLSQPPWIRASTWPALLVAAGLGLSARIGLEDDVLVLPDGAEAADNAALVRAGRDILAHRCSDS